MRILFATDGSQPANLARDLLASIRWPAGSTIRIITAVESAPVIIGAPWVPTGAIADVEAIEADLRARSEVVLAEAARGIHHAEWHVEARLLRGRAASCIVEDAREFGADLIVVGSRGHGGLLSMLLGSVASEVVDHAPCPVLVARRPALTRVVLAHDGSPYAMTAEGLLKSWPIFASVAVEVVSAAEQHGPWHVPTSLALYPPDQPDYFAPLRELLQHHRELAEAAADRLRQAGLRATPVVVEGDPAHALLHAAEERQADLILLGTHGRTGLARLMLGSVARNVLHHAHVSVLIARAAPASQ